MSEVKVNKLSPRSGTTVTLGDSGDTITIPSGVTLANSGTFTNFQSTGIDDNATETTITIDSNNNIGVGTSSPTNFGAGFKTLELKNASGDAIELVAGTGVIAQTIASNTNSLVYMGSRSNNSLVLTTNDTERMRIDSSGNVGIGNTTMSSFNSEANNLVVGTGAADEGITIYSGSSVGDHGSIFFADGTDVNAQRRGQIRYEQNNEVMSFFTNTSERMRIDVSGNVGINTTSPEAGSVQTISHPGSSKYGLNLDSSETSGTQYHLQFKRGGTQAGYITSNTATTISVNNASDERLKENIQNSGSAIQDIKDMQVRQFDWKDNIDTHRDFGFVAQELVNVVPEAVTQGTDELDDNGKPVRSWGVDYSHIVPRLVKVCQEQQTKIEELEARITQLENA